MNDSVLPPLYKDTRILFQYLEGTMITRIGALLVGLLFLLQPLAGLSMAEAAPFTQSAGPVSSIGPDGPIQRIGESSVFIDADGSAMTQVAGFSPVQATFSPDACTLPAPSLISPTGGTTFNTLVPNFQWSRTGDSYRVQISTSSAFSVLIYDRTWGIGGTANPMVRMNFNLSPNTTYYWRVASYCANHEMGAYSSPAQFRTGNVTGPFLNPPAMIAPANGAAQSSLEVTFSWGNVAGATAWQVRIYDSLAEAQNDDQWHQIPHTGMWSTSWYNNSTWIFQSAGTYYWRILAGTDAGWGSLSPIRSFTVGAPTYAVTGVVRDSTGGGIADVTISSGGRSAVTGVSGGYTLAGLPVGTHSLTPTKGGFTFSPASHTVLVSSNVTGVDFTGYDKPPIVFVHGWNGLSSSCDWAVPEDYFNQIDNVLHDSGYYVAYAHLESSFCYTPPIEDNVTCLDNAIQLAKAATHQPKVILIAHSMGGLVSRAYIEGSDYDNDVAQLFTFGSPHQGVPDDLLAFFANGLSLGAYCEYQAAVCDFSYLGMRLFNQSHPSPRPA